MRSKTFRVLRISIVLLALLGVAGGAATGPRPAAAADTPPISAMGGPHRISISASAFRPWKDGQLYENHGRYLKHLGGLSGLNYYYAPVYLPHGATVTKMTFYFLDNMPGAGDNIKASLMRTNLASIRGTMASVDSAGSSGYSSKSDDTIVNPTVDNSQYTYLLRWEMIPPVSDSEYAWGCGMVIEYTNPPMSALAGYISLPAAAFMPDTNSYDYENHARYLVQRNAPGVYGKYLAPIQLPDDATITRMTFHYRRNTDPATEPTSELHWTGLAGNYGIMASVGTSGGWTSPWYTSKSDATITNAQVDNAGYGYHAVWKNMPDTTFNPDGTPQLMVWGCGVVIEYGYRLYLPLTLRSYH